MLQQLNFSWIVPKQLAASGRPKNEKELLWIIKTQNIRSIITLTEDSLKKTIKNFSESIATKNICYYHIPTIDGKGFYPHQFDKIIKIYHESVMKSQPLLIHCDGGYGRTSTALVAIWIVDYQLTREDAVKQLKDIRPQVMITGLQTESLDIWVQRLKKRLHKKFPNDF